MSIVIKNRLIDQLKNCVEKMIETDDPSEKIYYVDIANELLSATLFFDNKKQYQAMHFVLNIVYNTINGMLEESEKEIPLSYFIKISECLDSIIKRMRMDEIFDDLLVEIMVLTFSITEFGKYFYEK